MKTRKKPIVALASEAVLLAGLFCQTASAQSVVVGTPGSSILANAFGTSSGPEALSVSWLVTQSGPIYTYFYQVNNPAGDVILNNNGSPTGTPEVVDAFSIAFDTTVLGAYISGTQAGGSSDQNNGASGLFWSFASVSPNSSSATLSFESDLPPTLGNANAQDANPPSPWSSSPFGQQVPVPAVVPEPATTAMFAFSGLLLLPVRSLRFRFMRK
jgi:hypothetical protein